MFQKTFRSIYIAMHFMHVSSAVLLFIFLSCNKFVIQKSLEKRENFMHKSEISLKNRRHPTSVTTFRAPISVH